jgi:methyl-accepting chemotaxis protein
MMELFQAAMLAAQMAILITMMVSLGRLTKRVRESREVAEHARASAEQLGSIGRSIVGAYEPVQRRLDDHGREIIQLKNRVGILEADQ